MKKLIPLTARFISFAFALCLFAPCSLIAQPQNGLIAHYPLNQDYLDYSGSDFHALPMNGTPVPGKDRGGNDSCAMYFDSENYLEIPADTAFMWSDTASFTISIWYKNVVISWEDIMTSAGYRNLFMLGPVNYFPASHSYGLSLFDLNQPLIRFGNQAELWYSFWDGYQDDSTWHHMVGVFENDKISMYYDNVFIGEEAINFNLPSTYNSMIMGKGLKGYMDDVYFYNRVLSADEIASLYYADPNCGENDEINGKLISGQVFYDYNGNNLKDTEDFYIEKFSIEIEPYGIINTSKPDGHFRFYVSPPEIFNLKLVDSYQDKFRFSVDPDTIDLDTFNSFVYAMGEIGIQPTNPEMDGSLSLTSYVSPWVSRPFQILDLTNTGNLVMNGDLRMRVIGHPESDIISSIPNYDSTISFDDTLSVYYSTNLKPFESISIRNSLRIPAPAGTKIQIELEYIDSTGYTLLDTTSIILLGPYDPNRITVDHKRVAKKFFEESSELTYDIHFQNLGDIHARDVIIRQILPPELDPETINIEMSSFPLTLKKTFDGTHYHLTWEFKDIYLPAISQDSLGSIGFVRFSIITEEIDPLEVIELEADIYFDFEEPVRTNTAQTRHYCPQMEEIYWTFPVISDASCYGEEDGSLIINLPDSLALDFYFEGQQMENPKDTFILKAGNYAYTVIDEFGCEEHWDFVISQPDPLTADVFQDGEYGVKISPQGGTAPFTITWNQDVAGFELEDLPNGEYHFIITDANGCRFEGEFTILRVSIAGVNQDQSTPSIFPNPVTTDLNISFKNEIFNLQLLDVTGKTLMYQINIAENATLNLSDLNSGIYLLKIENAKGEIFYHKIQKMN